MAGHSHWAGIKHKKAANDAKRGKVWSKCAKNIMLAAKNGGSNIQFNLKLAYAVEAAKETNMPKDRIEYAIKKGAGEIEGVIFEELMYEGFGPANVGYIIEVLTDNRHRTAPEMKKLFEKAGGKLGTPGSVKFGFQYKGMFAVKKEGTDENKVMEIALDAGAENMEDDGEYFSVTCAAADHHTVKTALLAAGLQLEADEIAWIPNTFVDISEHEAEKVERFKEAIEDHDDVQNVYTNHSVVTA
ncbi:MAG: YebC/PmpR family DNA-binding transcriptional regulator [Planctomycetes bacterium]|nr:YebC/PmpR family DNA-binding transcriptional regulator [Planctomycetota bacterium]